MRNPIIKIVLLLLTCLFIASAQNSKPYQIISYNKTLCEYDSLEVKCFISKIHKNSAINRIEFDWLYLNYNRIGTNRIYYVNDTSTVEKHIKFSPINLRRIFNRDTFTVILWTKVFVSNNVNESFISYDTLKLIVRQQLITKVILTNNKKYTIGDTIEFGLNVPYDTLNSRFYTETISAKRPKDKLGKDIPNKLIFNELGNIVVKFNGSHSSKDCNTDLVHTLKIEIVENIKFEIKHRQFYCGKTNNLKSNDTIYLLIKRTKELNTLDYVSSIKAYNDTQSGFYSNFKTDFKKSNDSLKIDTIFIYNNEIYKMFFWGSTLHVTINFKNCLNNDTLLIIKQRYLTGEPIINYNYRKNVINFPILKFENYTFERYFSSTIDSTIGQIFVGTSSCSIKFLNPESFRALLFISFLYKHIEGCFDSNVFLLNFSPGPTINYFNYKFGNKVLCKNSTHEYILLYFDSLKYNIELNYPSGKVLKSDSNSLMLDFNEIGKYLLKSQVIDTTNNKVDTWYDTITVNKPNIITNDIAPYVNFTQCDDTIKIFMPEEAFADSSFSSYYNLELFNDNMNLIERVNSITFTPLSNNVRVYNLYRKSASLFKIKVNKRNFSNGLFNCWLNDTSFTFNQNLNSPLQDSQGFNLIEYCIENRCSMKAIYSNSYKGRIKLKWLINDQKANSNQLIDIDDSQLIYKKDTTKIISCSFEVYKDSNKTGFPCAISESISKVINATTVEGSENPPILHPNPASDYITLQELGNYEIFSSTGEFIANGVNIDGKVNTENLPAGIYFVKINSKSYKFIKE